MKINVTQISTDYRATWVFGKTYWYPFGVAIDWAEITDGMSVAELYESYGVIHKEEQCPLCSIVE